MKDKSLIRPNIPISLPRKIIHQSKMSEHPHRPKDAARVLSLSSSTLSIPTVQQLQHTIGNSAVSRIALTQNGANSLIMREPIELPALYVSGDPQFYTRALRLNRHYSVNPPREGWPYNESLNQYWQNGNYDGFADKVREIQENLLGLTGRQADGILGPQTTQLMKSKDSTIANKDIATTSSPYPDSLELVARNGPLLVFNRPAFREEVVKYIWKGKFLPNEIEFYARPDGNKKHFSLGNTHWAISLFAARPDMMRLMNQEVRKQIGNLPGQVSDRSLCPVKWIPQKIWQQFLKENDGIYRYPKVSSIGTDVILIKRDGRPYGGYAEAPISEERLYKQMHVTPPGLVRRLLGNETSDQARIRWLAKANIGYNKFMWKQVQTGINPQQAEKNYIEWTQKAFIQAFIPAIGFAGVR